MSDPKHKLSQSGKPLPRQRALRLSPVCHAIALMLSAGAAVNAQAGVNLANVGAQINAARSAAAGGGANLGVGVSPQQAFQASQPSIQNLAHAAQGIAQQIAAQQAAAVAGLNSPSTVPNGLVPGGLQVAQGITFVKDSNGNQVSQNTDTTSPLLWINAYGPQPKPNADGTVTVDVQQTAQTAVVTWQTMNVGRQTTLNFDQSAGTQSNGANNWVVLNRIMDPSGAPSQILGNVTAQGSVYVINRNGILFGAGSQVNVHSLVASSMDLLNQNDDLIPTSADIVNNNKLFLSLPAGTDGGLAPLEQGQNNPVGSTGVPNEVLGLGNTVSVSSASQYQAPGDISIAPGASITTHSNGPASDGGLVLIAATNVNNGGSIVATDGQVILAAGVGVSLTPNGVNPQVLLPELSGRVTVGSQVFAPDITPAGTLTNTGIVQAARGTVDLLGSNVNQSGVVGVTTSVSVPGSILISTVDENVANTPTNTGYFGPNSVVSSQNGQDETNRAGQLVFGDGSVTTIMPDNNGDTDTSTPGTTFNPGTIKMTAGSVWFQSGSLIEAPGSSVSVTALTPSTALDVAPPGDTAVPGRIYLDTGATIDVSGLANVELPISDILLTVPLIGANELANSPLLRDGFLNGLKNVIVDSTLSGTNSDGSQWVGSPILNLSGAVSLMPRTVDQLLINGGTITLSGAQVMTADGSSLNLNGGYIHYDGGVVDTTRLIDANGAIVPIGQASPFDTYVGIAGEFVESHPRWGVTTDWFDPLLSSGAFEADYIVGGNAGTLNVYASQAMVLDGDMTAQAFGGEKQVQGNAQPIGGSFNLGTQAALGTLGFNASINGESGAVILQNDAPQLNDLSSGFNANTPLNTAVLGALPSTDPDNVFANTVVPVDMLNSGGFANVTINESGSTAPSNGITVAAGTQLTVRPGGSIKFNSPDAGVNIFGDLVAPSGAISITANGDIVVGSNAQINVAGQWVNNDTQTAPGTTPGDSEYINGGSITLSTAEDSSAGSGSTSQFIADTSGSIELQAGSVIDVSSGGELQANGQMLMQNGIAEGTAGSLSLITYASSPTSVYGSSGAPLLPTNQPSAGQIEMDGTIKSEGFAGGGTLTLQALGFQIGGDPTQTPAGALYLPADFFAQQGFGKYVLNAMYDATVAPGATVALTQQNLIPDVTSLQHAVSGTDIAASGLVASGTLDPYHRQATDLVITAGDDVTWRTAAGASPQYADAGVTNAVTVSAGASIVGDAGASIGLGSPAQVTVLGSIIAPGGSITLSADTNDRDSNHDSFALPGQETVEVFTSPSQSVWLGPNAVLDVAGVALTNPLAAPVRDGLQTLTLDTGKVLPGGSVVISDDSGYVVAQAGAVVNVSGASATFDELQSAGQYAPQQVWSDAGSITLAAASGLYFDATLQAQPGAAQAQGGTLTILPEQDTSQRGTAATGTPSALALILQQSGDLVPAGLMPGQSFAGVNGMLPAGVLEFSADRLTGSGVATLVLGEGTSATAAAPVPVAFAGNVTLTLSGSVVIDAGQIVALPAGSTSVPTLNAGVDAIGAPTVTIDAPYVALVGPTFNSQSGAFAPVEAASDGTLAINASFIDLENQVQLNNFGNANFTSGGDIRLSSTNTSPNGNGTLAPGALFTSGNLTFRAADVYPSTGSTFALEAVGPGEATTITFLPNGTSGVPLSAGGTLLVDATDIVQSGTVRAPSGSLIFGVGDPTDTATQTQFNSSSLVATDSVSLTDGSVTSVSNDGTVIPFGTTVDGVEWQFSPIAGTTAADVTAPPSKFVSVNGSSVSLNPGATIDLSGGGDLQAEEWVPGTGGTRDLLSQYNVSFAANPGGAAVPVNQGAANVYAVLPGMQSPVAAYDPVFAQTTQPSTNANGTVSTQTVSSGVGQAALNSAVGESVYLSGVPGLPAGYYTLLPAKYATLPGAFRVTVSSVSGAVVPGASQILPDGTVAVAGYMGNALSGSRSATPTLFDVQSGAVWQQYSQYTLTSANAFFPPLAAGAGNVTPSLPLDAGHLVLAASQGLTLGATLNTAAAPGGAPAEIDIASQDIQIVGNGEAALPGYLQISADQLDALDAGSLLIGGTRTQTTSGITIDTIANSVVVSNDAADPLSGPEIILVTKSGSTGTDPNAANGLRVDAGSVITAQGSYPAAKDQPITIGQNADSTTNTDAVSGDGALLSVSNGGDSVVTRLDTTGTGLLTVGAGATLTGGQALTLDSSGNLTFDPTATLSGNTIAVDGSAITFTSQTGAAAAALPGFVVGPTQLAQLAAAQEVILRSAGTMNFDGTVDVTFGNAVDLSAGAFVSDGGAVTINAKDVTLSNETGAPVPTSTTGSGTLTINANEIDFGTGDRAVNGFDSATFNATGGIVGQGTGTFDFGALPVTFNAPVYLADTSSEQTIQTTGTLNLNSATGTPLTLTPVGGALSFTGGTINDNGATIEAPAGNVSLEATTGDLTIGNGSLISSAGVSKQFFDEIVFAPGGAIALTADTGNVNVEAGSTLDFSAANGGGAAGSLTLAAPDQAVQLAGTIKGNAAPGFRGGSFSLNTGAAVDLDNLSAELASSGVNDGISVWTHAGNLILSAGNTLTAQTVSLIADGGAGNALDTANGNVVINGTINANGVATVAGGGEGGTINLYGKSSVDIEGTLLAEGSDAYVAGAPTPTINPNSTELGGTINIGTSGTPTAGSYNTQYGYENVALANSGRITLGANASIDVSGGGALTMASDGLQGGTVNIRAPLLDGAIVNQSVNVVVNMTHPATQITGARSVDLEAYAVWSTDDQTTGAQHFDGIVDPAGWYDSSGNLLPGTFTTQSGQTISYTPGSLTPTELATDLANDFFTPTNYNTDHETFYGYQNGDATAAVPGTLMGFVERGLTGVATQFAATGIADFNVVPGIDLDNPDPAINSGNISILTNWNLGAGTSATNLAFRFNGQAPIITFRAENNVEVDASLTDGFFQISNPTAPPLQTITITAPTPVTASAAYTEFFCGGGYCAANGSDYYSLAYANMLNYAGALAAPAAANDPAFAGGDTAAIDQYYGLYEEYQTYVRAGNTPGNTIFRDAAEGAQADPPAPGQPLFTESVPTAAMEQADNTAYLRYFSDYQTYANKLAAWASLEQNEGIQFQAIPLEPPPVVLTSPIQNSSQTTGSIPTDNTPSPVATSTNGLPLQTASLNGGSSSSFRIVAGADVSSANPLSVQAASMFAATTGGSVTFGGHFAFVDANGLGLLAPTTIRTGTGSINIAAANNVELFDPTQQNVAGELIVPGVIYTAGATAAGAPTGDAATIVRGSSASSDPDILVAPTVSPDSGGNISIHAQNDIVGMEDVSDPTGVVTGFAGSNISQFWWQWMQIGNPTNSAGQITQTSINFGEFDQGVMSVGGNVSVSAGGNITDLAVSLPTTWYSTNNDATVNTVGGGNLTVTAGGSILSGDYFVAKGMGTITAGGQIGPDPSLSLQSFDVTPVGVTPVSTVLATQDGILDVSARQGANIGGVFDPSYVSNNVLLNAYHQHPDEQGYSSTSAVNVESTTGDIDFGTLGGTLGATLPASGGSSSELPASVSLTAFTGGITVSADGSLFPSATGNLNLIADQSINLSGVDLFGMSDADPSSMPSPTQQDAVANAHDETALHADDRVPARIYSLTGSIVDGILGLPGTQNAGFSSHLVNVVIDKPALIEAGQDIVNLVFQGQNLRDSDVTRIVAGRDIVDSPFIGSVVPALVLGGPGTFDVEAGRNIGPLSTAANGGVGLSSVPTGIDAVGNANNPNLPHESANIQVLFGIGPGIDDADFIATYINPASTAAGVPSTTSALIAFMEQYNAGQSVDTGLVANQPALQPLSAIEAWQQFQALPAYVQQSFVQQVFFSVLTDVGNDFNNPSSPFFNQYSRGFQAINTLFPASLGYTANNLGGGTNGANAPVQTGNLDIRSTTIQTQQGGNVSILGPGGEALVGSSSAPPEIVNSSGQVVAGPGTMGILTLEQGDIDIFLDQSLLLAQSRVFTEQGGSMTIWSSNGNIDAGKGSTSVADIPPPQYVCDVNHYCTIDAKGEVTGAGIATLQTIPGVAVGDVNLLTPRGTVDAGAAGIRVSGNLNIAALHVLNADNIQVQGKATGIPIVAAVDTGALTAGSAATSAVTQMAQNLVRNNASGVQQRHWIITVQVEGFGDSNDDSSDDLKKKRKAIPVSYNPTSDVTVLGFGAVGATQRTFLSKEEQDRASRDW
jgi:filamentous hemagglutinin family protein